MMKNVWIGTKNGGKVRDFKHLLKKRGVNVKSLLDLSESIVVEETGETFTENAVLKAETLSRHLNDVVIADDSGLTIDVLDGKPGIYSARYAGEDKNDEANLQKVLQEMDGVPWEKRRAAFVCVIAVAIPGDRTFVFEGTCQGYVTDSPRGDHGFGYDPIFYVPEKKKTMAELTTEEKNEVSHRRKAMDQLELEWDNIFPWT